MSAVGNALLGEALKIALPFIAEQITSFAVAKEPELKAYLEERFGHSNPLVHDVFQLLIEPELATIGGILTLLGTPQAAAVPPSSGVPAARAPQAAYPDYNDD